MDIALWEWDGNVLFIKCNVCGLKQVMYLKSPITWVLYPTEQFKVQ